MDAFEAITINAGETSIFLRRAGSGPPLLLLHGFPQTHLMWRDIVPYLLNDFTVVCPDLRGYGQSGCPPSTADHMPYSKRVMAKDMIVVMEQLGFAEWSVAGHDRGGRVAYRMALDHPQQVKRLAVLDIIPTADVWERAGKQIMEFWPWSLLSQTEPLPETLIAAAPHAVVDNTLSDWGTDAAVFSQAVRNAYIHALEDPAHVHAICEEFRAAYTIDHIHDTEDRKKANRIQCPVLALWSADGPVDNWYTEAGGPLAIWQNWALNVQGWPVKGGHFFPEAFPDATSRALHQFFAAE